MFHRPDQFSKNLLRDALSRVCTAETEVEVLAATQKIDVYTTPDPRAPRGASTGLLGELAEQPCLFEPFHDTPSLRQLRRCLNKQLTWHHELERRARAAGGASSAEPGRDKPAADEVLFPELVIIGPGPPRDRARRLRMQARRPGHLSRRLGPVSAPHRDLRAAQDAATLLLRLLGRGRWFTQALADLAALPEDAWEQSIATPLLVHFQLAGREHPTNEEDDVSAEIQAWFEDYQRKLRSEARSEGVTEGRRDGERSMLLRQLYARFGELPAATVARIEAARHRCHRALGERILGAQTLAEVLDDQPCTRLADRRPSGFGGRRLLRRLRRRRRLPALLLRLPPLLPSAPAAALLLRRPARRAARSHRRRPASRCAWPSRRRRRHTRPCSCPAGAVQSSGSAASAQCGAPRTVALPPAGPSSRARRPGPARPLLEPLSPRAGVNGSITSGTRRGMVSMKRWVWPASTKSSAGVYVRSIPETWPTRITSAPGGFDTKRTGTRSSERSSGWTTRRTSPTTGRRERDRRRPVAGSLQHRRRRRAGRERGQRQRRRAGRLAIELHRGAGRLRVELDHRRRRRAATSPPPPPPPRSHRRPRPRRAGATRRRRRPPRPPRPPRRRRSPPAARPHRDAARRPRRPARPDRAARSSRAARPAAPAPADRTGTAPPSRSPAARGSAAPSTTWPSGTAPGPRRPLCARPCAECRPFCRWRISVRRSSEPNESRTETASHRPSQAYCTTACCAVRIRIRSLARTSAKMCRPRASTGAS